MPQIQPCFPYNIIITNIIKLRNDSHKMPCLWHYLNAALLYFFLSQERLDCNIQMFSFWSVLYVDIDGRWITFQSLNNEIPVQLIVKKTYLVSARAFLNIYNIFPEMIIIKLMLISLRNNNKLLASIIFIFLLHIYPTSYSESYTYIETVEVAIKCRLMNITACNNSCQILFTTISSDGPTTATFTASKRRR